MRERIGVFLVGFLAGALCLYYVLWRTGGLVPGHPLALTTSELIKRPSAKSSPLPAPPVLTPTHALLPPEARPTAAVAPLATTSAPLTAPSLADFSLSGEILGLPVQGARRSDLHDSFDETRGEHRHEAIDVLAPRGTPVLAVTDGTIAKLLTSARGGLTIYEFDPRAIYCYSYAHLDSYVEGLREGQLVRRGERMASVGTSGDAPPNTPHLHFAISRLGPQKRWWEGLAVNPYPPLLAAAPKD